MPKTAVTHSRWNEIEEEALSPLFSRQLVTGTNLMLARLQMKKGSLVPMHSHMNEQLSYVVEGALRFSIDEREIVVRGGETLSIPPHVPHEAVALEDTLAFDVFTPPRQDWLDKQDAYLRQNVASDGAQK